MGNEERTLAGVGRTLIANGYEVSCYNRTKANAADLIAAGAVYCASPAEAAAGADIVISAVCVITSYSIHYTKLYDA